MSEIPTPTPRTDAAAWTTNYAEVEVVDSDFARQLERELAEVMKQRDALADALRALKELGPPSKAKDIITTALTTLEGRTE